MHRRSPIQLVRLPLWRIPSELSRSTGAQQDIPLRVALAVNCVGSVGAARGQPVPFGRDRPLRSSKVCSTVGDQGCIRS